LASRNFLRGLYFLFSKLIVSEIINFKFIRKGILIVCKINQQKLLTNLTHGVNIYS